MRSNQALAPDAELAAAQVLADQDLYFFSRYMFLKRKGYHWMQAKHHRLICDALMRVFNGSCKRLIINVPPRYSKTELAVVNFIAWALGKVPDAEFIHTSYSGSLATNNAWACRELVQHEAYQELFTDLQLRGDSSAKNNWKTTEGGTVYAVGAGGTITGFGAGKMREGFGGAIIIDDPHKADEARSDQIREGVIEWFQNTLESRKNDPQNTPIIVIMQRLHERDLSGWLLSGGNGEAWEQLVLPAIVDQGAPHEHALWPQMHTLDMLKQMQQSSPYTFTGQYQQNPTQPSGNIFKPDNINILEALPTDVIQWVRGWDFAATVPVVGRDPDWTAGVRLGKRRNGRYLIADVAHLRGAPDAVETALTNAAKRDGRVCVQDIPQDPGQAGKSQVAYFVKQLAGYRVKFSPESGDKVTRAEPFAAQVNAGNVDMIQADWNDKYIAEMRSFPSGTHDDMVDAGSRAFNRLTDTKPGIKISDNLLRRARA